MTVKTVSCGTVIADTAPASLFLASGMAEVFKERSLETWESVESPAEASDPSAAGVPLVSGFATDDLSFLSVLFGLSSTALTTALLSGSELEFVGAKSGMRCTGSSEAFGRN